VRTRGVVIGTSDAERKFPIFALLNDLDEAYKKANHMAEGEILRLFMGGACFAFRNMKIITSLLEAHLRLARRKKFLGHIAEVTYPDIPDRTKLLC